MPRGYSYELWLENGQLEEWHQRKARDPNERSDRHYPMYDYHKSERLRLEKLKKEKQS